MRKILSVILNIALFTGLFYTTNSTIAQTHNAEMQDVVRAVKSGPTNGGGIRRIGSSSSNVPSVRPIIATTPAKGGPESIKCPDYAFSSKGYISGHILKSIENSEKSIDVAVYGFTLTDVADALVKAKKRGVKVRVVANQQHVLSKPSDAYQKLMSAKIDLRTLRGTAEWGIMHNKIGIFDKDVVVMGSYNWTTAADQSNYENVVFRYDDEVVDGYQKYFDWMWKLSRPLSAGGLYDAIPVGNYGAPPSGTPSINFSGEMFPKFAFSPLGGTEELVVKAINASTKEIFICMYSLFSQEIGNALIEAKKRGVKIKIVMDRLQAGSSPMAPFFIENKIDQRWSKGYNGKGSMHHKYAIFDSKLLMTGSFNWSYSANTNNFENVFITDRAEDIRAYKTEFNAIYKDAFSPTSADIKEKPAPGAAAARGRFSEMPLVEVE